ncbi:MAG: DUF3137 domain-containing protein [Lachnospiraceae bacterium]|nr:DUF3137 domain-containing protein [Lachnospiraceae bacterium]
MTFSIMALCTKGKDFAREYKKHVVEHAASELFETYSYQPGEGFDKEVLEEKGLLKIKDGFKSNDMLSGTYHDVNFIRADIEMQKEFMTGEVLKGNWTMFSFQKPFHSDLQVTCGDLKKHSKINRGLFTSKDKKRHVFTTGNEAFDDEFVCSAQDEEEARTLLTPTVMSKLLSFHDRTGYSFVIGWVDQNIHLIVENGIDTAAPGAGKELAIGPAIEKTKNDFSIICEIIDEMMMSRSIFADYVMAELEKEKTQLGAGAAGVSDWAGPEDNTYETRGSNY